MMRRCLMIPLLMLLTACAPQPLPTERDGGIGGTGAPVE
jgi:hypothetical protein